MDFSLTPELETLTALTDAQRPRYASPPAPSSPPA